MKCTQCEAWAKECAELKIENQRLEHELARAAETLRGTKTMTDIKRTCDDPGHLPGCVCSPPYPKSMTIDERARKILDNVYSFETDDGEFLIPWIANELRAVQEEAAKEFRSMDALQTYQLGVKDGTLIGLEKAAEIVLYSRPDCRHNGLACKECLAERIREEAGKA